MDKLQIQYSPSYIVISHTETKLKEWKILTTHDFSYMLVARASSDRSVVGDEPGRANISLGRSLLCETEQKNEHIER